MNEFDILPFLKRHYTDCRRSGGVVLLSSWQRTSLVASRVHRQQAALTNSRVCG